MGRFTSFKLKKTLGALFFLVFSVVYGYHATQITLFSSVVEAFNARTMPIALSVTGVIFSLLLLVLPAAAEEQEEDFVGRVKHLDWAKVFYLFVSMAAYSLLFGYLGFFIATFLFLNAAFWIMGERSVRLMLLVSVSTIFTFWFLLSYLLGIYINPGLLLSSLLGA